MSLSFRKHVEWQIKIPSSFSGVAPPSPVTSPDFLIMGSEWRLEMHFEISYTDKLTYTISYSIYLCKRNEEESLSFAQRVANPKVLDKSFDITTYIQYNADDLALSRRSRVDSTIQKIASYYASDIKKYVYSYNNTLTFRVVCKFFMPTSDVVAKNEPGETSADSCSYADLDDLSEDLCNLLSSETSPSDVTLKCGDRTTLAHRAVLAARSKVFAAMFRNKMAESETGQVEIADMDAPDFELFLRFVYSGKIDYPSVDSAICLYAAGDKYDIPSLKKASSKYMICNLTTENCLRLLRLSEIHDGDEDFASATLKFVVKNLDGLQREEWSSFSAECPKLAIKVYEAQLASTLSKQVSCKKNCAK